MIRAGRLRHKVLLQINVPATADAAGHGDESWRTKAAAWASIEPIAGQERFRTQQIQPDATHAVRLRYHDLIDTTWRIKFGDRTFGIQSIQNRDERGESLELICKEAL